MFIPPLGLSGVMLSSLKVFVSGWKLKISVDSCEKHKMDSEEIDGTFMSYKYIGKTVKKRVCEEI